MKTSNLILLGLVGYAIYYYYKKQTKTDYPTAPNPKMPEGIIPVNETGVPKLINTNTGAAIEQTLDAAGKPVDTRYQVRYAIKGIPNII